MELLPLLEPADATRLLLARGPGLPADPRCSPVRIVIAATFVAEPLTSSLRLWSAAFGIPVEVEFAGFDQVLQTLLDPDSPFAGNAAGINVVLVRTEDLFPDADSRLPPLLSAIEALSRRHPGTLVVANLPPVVAPFVMLDPGQVAEIRANWRSRLGGLPGVRFLTSPQSSNGWESNGRQTRMESHGPHVLTPTTCFPTWD